MKRVHKKIKWYTQQFSGRMVENFGYPRLATEEHWDRFNYCKCCQIIVRNTNKSMLLWCNNSKKHQSSLAKVQ